MIAIVGPNGQWIRGTDRPTRKQARKDFAMESGTKWGHLWLLGYKVMKVNAN